MGNSHCVPQTPRRLRASFSRKSSLKGNREDSARKLAGLFGTEARPDGDTAANKIFHYIPGTVSRGACLSGALWHWAWSLSTILCFSCMIVCGKV